MCIFTGPVRSVARTKIFARVSEGRQLLAYAMRLDADAAVAMVLPLPVAAGRGDDAVRFVDLSGCAELFDDLAQLFPPPVGDLSVGFGAPAPQARARLAVFEVGSFVASYVPTVADFGRLDPRFRLSADVWRALPQLADHGFAVFQLGAGKTDVHPMALSFVARDPAEIHFPCVHVHDGAVHDVALFDHELYLQCDAAPSGPLAWEPSLWPPTANTLAATRGLLLDATVHRTMLTGMLGNRDVIVRRA